MCAGPSQQTINGKAVGTQSPDDAAAIRAQTASGAQGLLGVKLLSGFQVGARTGDSVLGWQSVAPPTQPDLADTALKNSKQGQLFSGQASTGYMATFLGKQ